MFLVLFSTICLIFFLQIKKWSFFINAIPRQIVLKQIPNKMKLGTFNINLKFYNNRVFKIAKLLNILDLDIIVLQECWNCFVFQTLSKVLNYDFSLSALNCKEMESSGICCFSKSPIQFNSYQRFQGAKFPETLIHKGILSCTIGLFQIITTHFLDTRDNSECINMLLATPKQQHMIVVGDFNICASCDVEAYAKLSKIGNNSFPFFEKTHSDHTYDYIFHRNTIVTEKQVIDMTNLSDHHGLVTTHKIMM